MKTTNTIGIALALASSLTVNLKAQDIYVILPGIQKVGEYTTSGATVNSSLISGFGSSISDLAISSVPEPSAIALAGLGAVAFWLGRRRKITFDGPLN
jgi:hypothetical protein